MLRTLILAVAVLAAPLTTATAQAGGCAGYIKVCARPGPAATGGGGESPFYVAVHDPITHKQTGARKCRSGCDHVAPEDRTLGG